MKKFSWFLMLAFLAFACQLQNEEVTTSDLASGATPGAYDISSSSSNGYTFTITIDQSDAQDISHLMFKFNDCEGEALNIGNIAAITANGVDVSEFLTPTTGQGDVCKGVFADPFIKLDLGFEADVVEVVITLDTKSSGGAFLIKSAQNCFGDGDPDYMFAYDCDNVCYDYEGETAWSAGSRYVARGNWATYTAYSAGTVNIYAGQHMLAGTATFSSVVDGKVTITIDLDEEWSFQEGDNAVKIQGYSVAPSGNPSPGRFTTYKGNDLKITVPAYNFYGIHLDVQRMVEVECPTEG
jgi:hypothetical protein